MGLHQDADLNAYTNYGLYTACQPAVFHSVFSWCVNSNTGSNKEGGRGVWGWGREATVQDRDQKEDKNEFERFAALRWFDTADNNVRTQNSDERIEKKYGKWWIQWRSTENKAFIKLN